MSYETICASRLRFANILRETGTRGRFYVMHCYQKEAFIGQTVPPLVKAVSRLTNLKLYPSSFYRILRSESKRKHSKGFFITQLATLEALNTFLADFELFFVVTMDLQKWILDPESLQEEKDGG